MTSHDVVDRVREISGERRVGHAGTLDPNATGLLIIGVGRESTKKVAKIAKDTKEYEAEIMLGEETTTGDVEGARIQVGGLKSLPVLSKIKEVLKSFEGKQEQVPPQYSAIKIRGKKAYELARKGEKVELKPRKITIYNIKLEEYSYPLLRFTCLVSSGTYIRALARDIGRKLGCGAYLKELRRTKIGRYKIKNAVKLEDLWTSSRQ